MTNPLTSIDSAVWELTLEEYEAARAAFANLERPADRAEADAIRDKYCEAEDTLLFLPAPDIEAVIFKLMILWKADLHSETDEALQKFTLIGDLRRMTWIND